MTADERDLINAAATASVKRNIEQVAPERAGKLSNIWSHYRPEVRVLDEAAGFTLEEGPYQKIYLSPKDGRMLWLAAFVSWRAIAGFFGFIFEKLLNTVELDLGSINLRSEELRSFFDYVALLARFLDLGKAETLGDVEWPNDVPEPDGLERDSLAVSDRACFDLAHFATAFAFLYELRHVMFFADGDSPASVQDEKMACDAFAFEFVIGQIPAAEEMKPGDSAEEIRRKRTMALALGISLPILIATSKHWGASETHPSVRQRFEQLVAVVDLPPSDRFWIYASALVLARLQAEGGLGLIKAGTARDLLLALLVRL